MAKKKMKRIMDNNPCDYYQLYHKLQDNDTEHQTKMVWRSNDKTTQRMMVMVILKGAVLYYISWWDFVGIKIKIVGMDPNCHHPKPRPSPHNFFDTSLFLYRKEINTHLRATSSQQNPTEFFLHSVFNFICGSWDFGGMNDW